MEAIFPIVVGVLLIAHGLVHLLWFAPNVDAAWPFRLDRSLLVPEQARRPVGIALVALAVAAFALLGLAIWGIPGLVSMWPALAIAGALASLAMLIAFWDRQLIWGVGIDSVILVLAVWRPAWTDRLV
jgi:hypothetical protein